jgi:outer membrane protein assembly factor BamE (lipoprotein component of BamABCDE complex)
MFLFKNHVKLLLLFIILSACQIQDPLKTHGIIYLENRSKKLIIDKTNKNDVIRIIGTPQIKNDINNSDWIYIERVLSKGKYHELGKHKLEENNVLVLSFDKFGILTDKKLFKKEDIKKLKFTKKNTENDLSKKSFVQSFLESVRQKMYSNRK